VLYARDGAEALELVHRELSPRGRPLAAPRRVAALPAGGRIASPALAWSAAGGWIAAWQREPAGGVARIRARWISPAHGPLGASLEVDDAVGIAGSEPRVAVAPDGSWLVVWTRAGIDRSDVVGRGFDPGMAPLDASQRISAGAGEQDRPDVAWLAPGRYLAVWEDDLSALDQILVRAIDGAARALGPWYRLHRDRSGAIEDRVMPRIASDGVRAIAVWMDRRRGLGFDVYHSALGGG
jgi:hypothetical protein